jgi:hypothetical protein
MSNHPHRISSDHTGKPLKIFTRGTAGHTAASSCKKPEMIGNGRHFIFQHSLKGFSAVQRFQFSQALSFLINSIGKFV